MGPLMGPLMGRDGSDRLLMGHDRLGVLVWVSVCILVLRKLLGALALSRKLVKEVGLMWCSKACLEES
jgi:hypothetical protein